MEDHALPLKLLTSRGMNDVYILCSCVPHNCTNPHVYNSIQDMFGSRPLRQLPAWRRNRTPGSVFGPCSSDEEGTKGPSILFSRAPASISSSSLQESMSSSHQKMTFYKELGEARAVFFLLKGAGAEKTSFFQLLLIDLIQIVTKLLSKLFLPNIFQNSFSSTREATL